MIGEHPDPSAKMFHRPAVNYEIGFRGVAYPLEIPIDHVVGAKAIKTIGDAR